MSKTDSHFLPGEKMITNYFHLVCYVLYFMFMYILFYVYILSPEKSLLFSLHNFNKFRHTSLTYNSMCLYSATCVLTYINCHGRLTVS